MSETITLQRKDGRWMATFKPGKKTRQFFGTDTIPTPFMDTVEADKVLERIQLLNPGVPILIAAEGFRLR